MLCQVLRQLCMKPFDEIYSSLGIYNSKQGLANHTLQETSLSFSRMIEKLSFPIGYLRFLFLAFSKSLAGQMISSVGIYYLKNRDLSLQLKCHAAHWLWMNSGRP